MKMEVESIQSIRSCYLYVISVSFGVSTNLSMTGIQVSRKKSLGEKKEELVGKNSYGFIYGLTRESEDNVHRLFADIVFVYIGPQSIA